MKLLISLFLFLLPFVAMADQDCHLSDAMDYPNEEQIEVINTVMAARDHRLWHYLWHGLREGWDDLDETERQYLAERLPESAIPTRYSRYEDNVFNRNSNAGEDFLYMHHVMIGHLTMKLTREGLCPIKGWTSLPTSYDDRYPLDPRNTLAQQYFYDEMELMRQWLTNRAYIRSVTLGQYGYDIEASLHGIMHGRWMWFEDDLSRPSVPLDGTIDDPDWQFDDPSYKNLGDPYSAHVNPIFWKLHGWIDDRIQDWLILNGYSRIAEECGDDETCYQWKGTWLGVPPGDLSRSVGTIMNVLRDLPSDVRESIEEKLHRNGKRMLGRALEEIDNEP